MNPYASCLFFALSVCWGAPAQAAPISISEVLYDASGSDDGLVFVELYGPAGALLDGLLLEGVNGSDGSITTTVALLGLIPGDGFFVVADTSGGATSVSNADLLANFDFQNGPDSIVLRAADGAALDALGYGVFGSGEVFAGEGSAATDPPAGHSLARRFANRDSDDNAADFEALALPTPGTGPVAVPAPRAVLRLAQRWCGGISCYKTIAER